MERDSDKGSEYSAIWLFGRESRLFQNVHEAETFDPELSVHSHSREIRSSQLTPLHFEALPVDSKFQARRSPMDCDFNGGVSNRFGSLKSAWSGRRRLKLIVLTLDFPDAIGKVTG